MGTLGRDKDRQEGIDHSVKDTQVVQHVSGCDRPMDLVARMDNPLVDHREGEALDTSVGMAYFGGTLCTCLDGGQ